MSDDTSRTTLAPPTQVGAAQIVVDEAGELGHGREVIYEFLAMRELRQKAGVVTLDDRGIAGLYSIPFFARFAAFVVLFFAFVGVAWWVLTNPAFKDNLGEVVSGLFLVFLIAGFWFSAKNPYKG